MAEPDIESKEAYLERLNSEIYIRDIVDRYNIRDVAGMETLMKAIASAIGSMTNAQKISDRLYRFGIKKRSFKFSSI